MAWVIGVTFLMLLIYSYFLLGRGYTLPRMTLGSDKHVEPGVFITVIIPFRNERENLEALVQDLHEQNLKPKFWEALFINDQSTDGSIEWLSKQNLPNNFKVIHSQGKGKKTAILEGIKKAKGRFTIFTDADCHWPKTGLEFSVRSILDPGIKLVLQPVVVDAGYNLLHYFQYLESLALLGFNQSVYLSGKPPVLASGANLVVDTKRFISLDPYASNQHIWSGDDMFLLEAFTNANPNEIVVNYRPENTVFTHPEKQFKSLLLQKIRWIRKMNAFKSNAANAYGLVIFFLQLLLLSLFILGLGLNKIYLIIGMAGLIFKGLIDLQLLNRISRQLDLKVIPWKVLFLEMAYLFYVPLVIILAGFVRPKWKGRKT